MKQLVFGLALVGALGTGVAYAQTSSNGSMLGSVHISTKMMADGKPLAAGTYQVRLTAEELKPGVGQSPSAERFVEFVKGGKVVGREVATVVNADEISQVVKGTPPKPGASKFEMLKGGYYWRVWINKGGTNYIINLPPSA